VEAHRKKKTDEEMEVETESSKTKFEKSNAGKKVNEAKGDKVPEKVGDADAKTAMSVAQSLLDLKNDSKLDSKESGATGPPCLKLPPRIEKTEKVEKTPPQSMPTLIPYPKQSPVGASALPPMPVLTPKPGLMKSVPSPGSKRGMGGNSLSPVPDSQTGKESPNSLNTSSQNIADNQTSPGGTSAGEQPPKLERRPTSPFQPVKPEPGSPNEALNNARYFLFLLRNG
jgi:hypothetical protein